MTSVRYGSKPETSVEGLQVKGSAKSLGLQTRPLSVVKAIFLVIVLDGVAAVFFASFGM